VFIFTLTSSKTDSPTLKKEMKVFFRTDYLHLVRRGGALQDRQMPAPYPLAKEGHSIWTTGLPVGLYSIVKR